MKILVTGGNGFIGSKYVKEIKKAGHRVEIFDLPDDDILDDDVIELAVKRNDMVVHFAAMADITQCQKVQDVNFEVNVVGTYNVAKWCARFQKKLIYISTCCVYGNVFDEITNEKTTNPQCCEPYATSKMAAEYMVRGVIDLDYAVLRIGTVYGIGMRPALFTHIALDRVQSGEKIWIDGDGDQVRQLIYIDDLVDGIVRATLKFNDLPKGSIINLCGEKHISAIDTMRVAENIVGKKANYEHREQRYGQTFKENISIQKAKDLLEWENKMDFEKGMKIAFKEDPSFVVKVKYE